MSDLAARSPGSLSRRSLYVYYRVHAGQTQAARTAIDTMQATLRPLQPGLSTRLLCRADDAPDAQSATWMEVYEHPEGVSAACESMLQKLADALPADLFAGQRHVEVFVALPDPVSASDSVSAS